MRCKGGLFFLLTILMSMLLIGCGEAKADTEVSTELGTGDGPELILEQPESTETKEIEYLEMEACFQVKNASDADNTFVDGETLDWTKWGRLETRIHLCNSMDIYNMIKAKVGYTKPNIDAVYIATDGEWSQLAIGESGYSVYVREADLTKAVGEAAYTEGIDVVLISNGVYGEGFYDGENINMNTLHPVSAKNILSTDINIYSQGKNVIGYVKQGAFVSVVTQSEEWTYVAVADGNYIVKTDELNKAALVTPVDMGLYAQNEANVRKEPNAEAEQVDSLSINEYVKITGELSDGWYQVRIDGVTGYVSKENLAENKVQIAAAEPSGDTPQAAPTPAINYPPGNYTPGSVYGPKLTQRELDEVAVAVNNFLASYNTAAMDDYTKVMTAHDYLCAVVSYAPTWAANRANTAWGALIYGEAQCSGYARAMKALCDAMGVGCYYVHADEYASNPSHQWNIVCVNGGWYIIDVQCNDSSGWNAVVLKSDDTYAMMTGMSWDRSIVPACPYDYMGY